MGKARWPRLGVWWLEACAVSGEKCGGIEGFSGFAGRGSQGNTGPTPIEHVTIFHFQRRRQKERGTRERERGWVSAAGMRTFFAALGLGLAAVPGIRACVIKCLGTCVLSAAVCLLSLVKGRLHMIQK